MKNVLVIESGSFKTFGGAANEAYDIYEYLRRTKRYEVDLFAELSRIDKNAKPVSLAQMKARQHDVVILNSIRDVPFVERYVLRGNSPNAKTIYIDRGNVIINFRDAGAKKILPKMLARQYFITRMRKWLDCYVALSAEQYKEALGFFTKKTQLTYLPIAAPEIFKSTSPKDKVGTGIYVGRLDERQKKVGKLIQGVERVVERHPTLRNRLLLRIVGSGPHAKRYKKQVADAGLERSIVFVGSVERDALPKLYNSSGFFVSHSEWEGMSATFVEAMACGLPLLLNDKNNTRIGNNPPVNMVEDDYNGVVFEYRDMDEFASWFYRLYADPDLRKRLSRNALLVSKEFNKEENLKTYGKIIDGLLSGTSVSKFVFKK